MLKRSLAAGLLACAALTPVAFAQSNPAPGKIQFIQTIDAQKFRGSELMGQSVYNDADEAIGDIGDVLLDKNGQAAGVVIDVGGFLGIGAREVAVPFNALRFEPMPDQTASATSGAGSNDSGRSAAEGQNAAKSTGGLPPGNASGGQAGSGMAADTSNTGTGSAAQSGAQGQSSSAIGGQIDSANQSSQQATQQSPLDNMRIVLNTTREELQNAPELQNPGEQNQESGASGGSGYGSSGSGAGAPAK
jgi:sporulation protein YlmC with PRC-barrel domain